MAAPVRRAVIGALTGTVVALAALTGCGAEDEVSERAAEEVLEQAAESGDVDVDIEGDELKVESSDGTFAMGGDIPEDFPTAVPLAEGEVLMASSSADGWSVLIEVDGAFDEVADVALDAILQAGFTEESRTSTPEYVALMASDDTYDVMLTVTGSDGGATTLSYSVTPVG